MDTLLLTLGTQIYQASILGTQHILPGINNSCSALMRCIVITPITQMKKAGHQMVKYLLQGQGWKSVPLTPCFNYFPHIFLPCSMTGIPAPSSTLLKQETECWRPREEKECPNGCFQAGI